MTIQDFTPGMSRALLPLTGWSDHVAELCLVVDPATRGRGIGRALAQQAVATRCAPA